jgi:hypothetical protein
MGTVEEEGDGAFAKKKRIRDVLTELGASAG